jgi:hypothetical protein
MVKHRNIFLIYLFALLTFGIYSIYWTVSTKNEINSLGAKIPTAWLLIVPIANMYWIYKYCEGFSENAKKDNNTILWFILYIIGVGLIMPAIIQSELNKLASNTTPPKTSQPAPATTPEPPVQPTTPTPAQTATPAPVQPTTPAPAQPTTSTPVQPATAPVQ